MTKIKLWLIGFLSATTFYTLSAQALTTNIGTEISPAHFNFERNFTTPSSQPFADWLAFTVSSSLFDSTTIGIKLSTVFGITNLETKLYQGGLSSAGEAQPEALVASGSIISTSKSTLNIISPIVISGNYLLNITGIVTGSNGGNYAGIVNLGPTSVPAPGMLSLLVSGMALMGAFYRKSAVRKN